MFSDSFLRYFPVPAYLQFPAVGFDVSDGEVKFVQLKRRGEHVKVGDFGRRPYSNDLPGVLASIRERYGFGMVNVAILEDTDVLGRYLDAFKQAGLQPVCLITVAEAIARAVVPLNERGSVLVVRTGRVSNVLSIVAGGRAEVSGVYPVNGADDVVERAKAIITTYQGGNVDRVILCEAGPSSSPLAEHLSAALNLKVTRAEPWINVLDTEKYVPPISREEVVDYSAAIGLALSSLK